MQYRFAKRSREKGSKIKTQNDKLRKNAYIW